MFPCGRTQCKTVSLLGLDVECGELANLSYSSYESHIAAKCLEQTKSTSVREMVLENCQKRELPENLAAYWRRSSVDCIYSCQYTETPNCLSEFEINGCWVIIILW
ncbi:unnamed protein product [Enterobius vermicularis]|uniref:Apple domain-containing protein n=1 Tax=Enterobius vermicularis TaxID=51028 RepID=A0A0N4V765_ENTVE|nr:unnamed protein product [Enterobius vermicularis]